MPEAFSVVVFCGASTGHDPIFRIAATTLGAAIAEAGMRLVYGGGRVGLMGAVADGAIGAGGQVIGVIPDFLARWEVAHDGV
ncbi:MAG: TIGR00730 family Rossman fold protein, partial [Rhodospirillales bacterium]|nr:TIGR00730 family Rossman fold protein [Rhodospirillales bacterium]